MRMHPHSRALMCPVILAALAGHAIAQHTQPEIHQFFGQALGSPPSAVPALNPWYLNHIQIVWVSGTANPTVYFPIWIRPLQGDNPTHTQISAYQFEIAATTDGAPLQFVSGSMRNLGSGAVVTQPAAGDGALSANGPPGNRNLVSTMGAFWPFGALRDDGGVIPFDDPATGSYYLGYVAVRASAVGSIAAQLWFNTPRTGNTYYTSQAGSLNTVAFGARDEGTLNSERYSDPTRDVIGSLNAHFSTRPDAAIYYGGDPGPCQPGACCIPIHASCISEWCAPCYSVGGQWLGNNIPCNCCADRPAIIASPGNASRCAGESVTFSVNATGAPPLTYRWVHSGFSDVITSTPSFTIPSVSASDAGAYFVGVGNSCGQAQSAYFTLAVNSTPGQPTVVESQSFSSPPSTWISRGGATFAGASQTLRLTASGTQNSAGAAFYAGRGLVSRSFEAECDFEISGVTGFVADATGVVGPDGLCLIVAETVPTHAGEAGRGLGYGGLAGASFAVELDAFANLAYADPDSNHVGLDIAGSLVSLVTAPFAPNFETPGTWHARMRVENGQLSVFLTPPGGSAALALAAPIPAAAIPAIKYFGVASGTGLNTATVDIDNVVLRQLDTDCNTDGVADACQISRGTIPDADTDGIPDICEPSTQFCASCAGDMNGDHSVDGTDTQQFVNCVLAPSAACLCADLDANQVVDSQDVLLFVGQLQAANPPGWLCP